MPGTAEKRLGSSESGRDAGLAGPGAGMLVFQGLLPFQLVGVCQPGG